MVGMKCSEVKGGQLLEGLQGHAEESVVPSQEGSLIVGHCWEVRMPATQGLRPWTVGTMPALGTA